MPWVGFVKPDKTMKAKAVKAFDDKNPEVDIWTVLIQRNEGAKYNLPVLGQDGKSIYSTNHKAEAEEKANRLNESFSAQVTIPIREDYGINRDLIQKTVNDIESGEIGIELEKEIILYCKAIRYLSRDAKKHFGTTGYLDDWECVMGDLLFAPLP